MQGTEAAHDTVVIHAQWADRRLHVWGESLAAWARPEPRVEPGHDHPFAADAGALERLLVAAGVTAAHAPAALDLMLPSAAGGPGRPAPSLRLAHAAGHVARAGAEKPSLGRYRAPSLRIDPEHAADVLEALDAPERPEPIAAGPTVAFFASAARLARHLLAQQRFVPSLRQAPGGGLHGLWQPWLSDGPTAVRVAALLQTMPPAARAAVDEADHHPWTILESFLTAVVDAECRRVLTRESMAEAIESRDRSDAHVAWLGGLLRRDGDSDEITVLPSQRTEMVRLVRRWIGGLEDRGASAAWRLNLRLREPEDARLLGKDDPGENCEWPLSFGLQSQENARIVLDAEDIWLLPTDSVTIEGRRADQPQELLVKELTRAARMYPLLERALNESQPSGISLNTRQAYQFLREVRPVLLEQGFAVEVPPWWDEPAARLGARLKLSGEEPSPVAPAGRGAVSTRTALGLEALVTYAWEISVGGTTLTLQEFERLAARRTPLVRLHGKWVEIRPEDVQAAVRFIRENPGGQMSVGDAVRLAYGASLRTTGIPIVGLQTTGWISAFFGSEGEGVNEQIPFVDPPRGFHGVLRPYQLRGLSWLVFLEKFGFGPCLADDMGLGKTIQLLALLAYERERAREVRAAAAAGTGQGLGDTGQPPAGGLLVQPTLIVVPLSVVGNWVHEAQRFCPELKVLVHHGLSREEGDTFVAAAEAADVVLTTYALVHRDRDTLAKVHWQRVVLDEAQTVKNPSTKQSVSVRSLMANTRVCLTGTPVENRLSELWSIMDFLNPGYLGPSGAFRSRFAVPVERYRDQHKAAQLRELVKPFLLRRLKTDPAVAADLPEKVETREYSHLTSEQAELYESIVRRMLGQVDRAEGMRRRGLVLASLVKLKQVCNHPSQLLRDHDPSSPAPPAAARSGKCQRLIQMVDEVMASGEQALIFTQFRQMALLLAPMLRHDLDREVLVMHGGTAQADRDAIVRRFQEADGTAPILVVSLKAGGVGLNLTAATHVFHFDRWWNPAVENQATDRAYRIGQTRRVQVHKFVVRGTLEERIDEMIEQKTALAEHIIGSGERWLTELSTDQLRDLLTLRRDAVGDEE